ncbi:hypothetical protein DPMN_002625 [Dreissena polymorpha]|uniref:Uncharacterized protein n=1 Tax=Dreissena polymorpha TaxID=45954 RepID=A0A9D4MJJ9_DREPO|nr:hypothetical protein DPMN_002109 [Dreissena polymorpha]KAH3878726.1 hypothetical protein DPMN_002625 [Dreissena polymorpha]
MATTPTIAVTDDGLASSATAAAGATRSLINGPFRRHFRNSEDLHERSKLL